MSINFALGIVDRISGPSNFAGRALRSLQGELKATEKALKAVNNVTTKNRIALLAPGITAQARQAINLANRQLQADRLQLEMNRRIREDKDKLFSSMHAGFSSIVTWAAGATVGIAAMSAELIKAAGHMSDVRRITMGFLTQQMGAHEAVDQMQRLEQFSVRFGVGLEEAATNYHRLVAQGFDSNWAMALMQGAEDVASVMGRDASEGLLRDISTLRQEGQIDMRHLRALSFFGVGIGDVTAEIARARNQSNPHGQQLTGRDIMEMVPKREIEGMETAAAALRVIQQRYSGGENERLGTRAVGQIDTTFGGAIRRLDARWHIFLSRLGTGNSFDPLIRLFDRIGATLEGTGVKAFEDMLKKMGEVAEGVDWADLINDAADAMPRLLGFLTGLIERLDKSYKGWKMLWDLAHGKVPGAGAGTSMPESQRGVGMAPVTDRPGTMIPHALEAASRAARWLVDTSPTGGLGQSFGRRALNYMRANSGTVEAEARRVGANAAAATEEGYRDQAEIHSPSRVFTRLGVNMIEGLDIGMQRRIAQLESMGDMLGTVSGGTITAGGAQSVSVGDIHVSVQGEADAEEIGRAVKRHLASILTSVGSSKGVNT